MGKIYICIFGFLLGAAVCYIVNNRSDMKPVPAVVIKDTVHIKDVEQVIEIKEVLSYHTDTVWLTDTVTDIDTSLYHVYNYEDINDTSSYTLSLCSKEEPLWYKFWCQHNNKITLIQTPDSMFVQSSNSFIQDINVNKKVSWKSKFKPTVGVGFGYGLTKQKFDVYVGAGISYTF